MNNTIDFTNKTVQTATLAVMNDILTSDVTGTGMDDAYKAVGKYVNITKEKFDDYFNRASQQINSWKNAFNGSSSELNDEDLEMVAGGGDSDFLNVIWDGIKTGACAVGNFVKEHAGELALIAILAASFAVGGLIIGSAVGYALGASALGGGIGAAAGFTGGAALGSYLFFGQ